MAKTHRYTRQVQGVHYLIEPEPEAGFSMTAYGVGLAPGDYVVLQEGSAAVRYRIEQIEYYGDRSDLWTALLIQLP